MALRSIALLESLMERTGLLERFGFWGLMPAIPCGEMGFYKRGPSFGCQHNLIESRRWTVGSSGWEFLFIRFSSVFRGFLDPLRSLSWLFDWKGARLLVFMVRPFPWGSLLSAPLDVTFVAQGIFLHF